MRSVALDVLTGIVAVGWLYIVSVGALGALFVLSVGASGLKRVLWWRQ